MPRFLYLGRYSGDGVGGIVAEGGSSREAETRAAFEQLGARVETYMFAMGPDADFVIIAEVPDTVTAIVPPMLASAGGKVDVRTTLLLSPAELDAAAAKARAMTFRPAGD